MAYHEWGDETVDWKGIGEAANFIQEYCMRWGRLGGQSKEKYGTVRFYARFGYLSLHNLVYPGYNYSQFPDWLWHLDCNYIAGILNKLFGVVFIKWQILVYRRAYRLAVKKWPHLRNEILSGADYLEVLDDCDDIKLQWTPPQFSKADKKRIGPRLLKWIEEQIEARSKKLDEEE